MLGTGLSVNGAALRRPRPPSAASIQPIVLIGASNTAGGDDTGEVLDPDLLVLGDVRACDDPLSEVSYTEVGA